VKESAVFKEFFQYAHARKKYFLFPVIVLLLILATLLIFAEGTALGPFIYTLF